MNSVEQLREQLAEVFERIKSGSMKPAEGAELANIAGKMISSAKVQLEYYALRKEKPSIDFLTAKK